MNAIIEYIQRFLLDNNSNQKKLANVAILKTLINELENKIRSDMKIEELKELGEHKPKDIFEALRRMRDDNIERYGQFGSQIW